MPEVRAALYDTLVLALVQPARQEAFGIDTLGLFGLKPTGLQAFV